MAEDRAESMKLRWCVTVFGSRRWLWAEKKMKRDLPILMVRGWSFGDWL